MISGMHTNPSLSAVDDWPSNRPSRRGISLFEVVLSLAIFLGAFLALSQLSQTGMTAAVQARLKTKAVLRCETKLAELTSAVEPLADATDQPFGDDPNWTWSVLIAPGPHADLLLLTVSVRYDGGSESSAASFSMSRLMRDPVVFEPPPIEESGDGV